MKISNRLMLLGGVVGLTLAAAAPAFADMGAPGMSPWQKADANQDGIIDQSEFAAGQAAHFKAIDANADGSVTPEEMKAFREQQRAKMEEKRAEMAAKFFQTADKNSDGKIVAAEWPQDGRLKFEKADANGDGAVTADELGKAHKPRDGKPDESKGRFVRLDTDKDGKLSVTEWNAMGDKMFARLDDNKDGKITKDEMPKHRKDDGHKDGDAPVQP